MATSACNMWLWSVSAVKLSSCQAVKQITQINTDWWFHPIWKKYHIVNWDDCSQYGKNMFQTTNQNMWVICDASKPWCFRLGALKWFVDGWFFPRTWKNIGFDWHVLTHALEVMVRNFCPTYHQQRVLTHVWTSGFQLNIVETSLELGRDHWVDCITTILIQPVFSPMISHTTCVHLKQLVIRLPHKPWSKPQSRSLQCSPWDFWKSMETLFQVILANSQ